jgi:hypothetical protein
MRCQAPAPGRRRSRRCHRCSTRSPAAARTVLHSSDQAFQDFNPPAVFQQQGSSAIFAALDPNGTGSVSKQDFVSGMSQLMVSLRAEGGSSGASGPSPSQTLASSIQSLNSIDPASVPSDAQPGALFSVTA